MSETDCVKTTGDDPVLAPALELFGLGGARAELIRHNENMTYKVTGGGERYVLRVHKPVDGFAADIYKMAASRVELIQNELDIIDALRNGTGIRMQTPVRGAGGGYVQALADGTPVTLLEWVDGATVEAAGTTDEILADSGIMLAEMHGFFARKDEQAKKYTRMRYDQSVLPEIADRISTAEKTGVLTGSQAKSVILSLDEARRRFDELDAMYEKHILHADMGVSNVIVGPDGRLTPIDFSLCGYSHYYMDLAGIYSLNYDDQRRNIILENYVKTRKCEIEARYLEPYFMLNIVLFIACQYERAKDWDWFPEKMEQWRTEVFQPLAAGVPFLKL